MSQKTAVLVVLAIVAVVVLSSYKVVFAEGDSMNPTFSGCALVLADEDFPASQAVEGDIVVVDVADREMQFDRIAHRIVENRVEREEFSTRGDNSAYYEFPSSIDGFFGYDRFLGKVEHFYNLPSIVCNVKGVF